MKTVLMTNDELLRVLSGRELQVSTNSGERVQVRLLTPFELLKLHKLSCDRLNAKPSMSMDFARNLTRPYNLWTLAKELGIEI